jgi:hypothetical protein
MKKGPGHIIEQRRSPVTRRLRERLAFWALVLGFAGLPAALLLGWAALGLALLGFASFTFLGRAGVRERLPELPAPASGLRSAALIACDEAMLGLMQIRADVPGDAEVGQVARELELGIRLRRSAPDPFERQPPPLRDPELAPLAFRGERFAELRGESGWAPAAGEPGLERWLARDANRELRAALLRHPGAPRPWLICVHGYRMGQPGLNLRLFDPLRLYRGLGLNLLVPVLPLHGSRRAGARSGDLFLDGRLVDTHHALRQSVWDLRRLIGWAREQGPAVGVYGVSLGALPSALLAALEPELDLILLGTPLADVTDALWHHAPPDRLHAFAASGVTRELAEQWFEPVAALTQAPKLPPERLAIYAATGDRIVPPHHAARLWEHWSRPPLQWLDGGHLTFFSDKRFRSFEARALSQLWD